MEGDFFLTGTDIEEKQPYKPLIKVGTQRSPQLPKSLSSTLKTQTQRLPKIQSTKNLTQKRSLTKAARSGRSVSSLNSSSRFNRTKSIDKLSVAHEVLDSIAREASEDMDNFFEKEGDMAQIKELEASENVAKQISIMKNFVKFSMSKYNFIVEENNQLEKKLANLQQTYLDVMADPDKAIMQLRGVIQNLNKRFDDLKTQTVKQGEYRTSLKHMIHVRKIDVNMLTQPIKQLRSKVAATEHGRVDKEREFHRLITQIRGSERQLETKQRNLDIQKDRQQQTIAKELKRYKDKCKAIQIYKREQENTEMRLMLKQRDQDLAKLKQDHKKALQIEQYESHCEEKTQELADLEGKFGLLTKNTQIKSLSDINNHWEYLKETNENLMLTRDELQISINKAKEELNALRDDLETCQLTDRDHDIPQALSQDAQEEQVLVSSRSLDTKIRYLRNLNMMVAKSNCVFERLIAKMNPDDKEVITTGKVLSKFQQKLFEMHDFVNQTSKPIQDTIEFN